MRSLGTAELTSLPREELTELTRMFEIQTRRIPAARHRLVAEIEQRQLGHELGVRHRDPLGSARPTAAVIG